MTAPSQTQDLLFDRDWDPSCQIVARSPFPKYQPRFASNLKALFPFGEPAAGDAEVSAGLRDVLDFRGMYEDFESELNLVLNFGNAHSRPHVIGASCST